MLVYVLNSCPCRGIDHEVHVDRGEAAGRIVAAMPDMGPDDLVRLGRWAERALSVADVEMARAVGKVRELVENAADVSRPFHLCASFYGPLRDAQMHGPGSKDCWVQIRERVLVTGSSQRGHVVWEYDRALETWSKKGSYEDRASATAEVARLVAGGAHADVFDQDHDPNPRYE